MTVSPASPLRRRRSLFKGSWASLLLALSLSQTLSKSTRVASKCPDAVLSFSVNLSSYTTMKSDNEKRTRTMSYLQMIISIASGKYILVCKKSGFVYGKRCGYSLRSIRASAPHGGPAPWHIHKDISRDALLLADGFRRTRE
ncbi:hypothetical protein B0T26DRAFT_702729 [Lasiosphaeria miniovina]|uniref:Secreted protein n=1 Tax=Lasiosphaeria miniovina TaxID=1954250 RepID=A0AA40DZL5_9PEZI|nr:uncharacterized protein B0T26DRAFT_702729 [Lasiosphaeria miniovina]KAK0722449.1 hypothetical protein B0T26DRAFT_702729 [Lasiosphaeria miniovina]